MWSKQRRRKMAQAASCNDEVERLYSTMMQFKDKLLRSASMVQNVQVLAALWEIKVSSIKFIQDSLFQTPSLFPLQRISPTRR